MAKHVVGRVSDIPDGGRILVTLQGHSVGIFNVGGRFHAVLNRCPHQGAELCLGSVVGRLESSAPGEFRYTPGEVFIQCPWHGWEYDLRTGQSYFRSRVRAYPVDVEGGEVVVSELESGAAHAMDDDGRSAAGPCSARLREGPYRAEVYPVAIEDDYVVVTLPGQNARKR
jgi:3-phenylpropionate/trans-cinnamate dioxygenase ferredoxin subunit